MRSIVFIDTEVNPATRKVTDIGAIKDNGAKFHAGSLTEFAHKCRERLAELYSKGYTLKHARVNFMVYWKKEEEMFLILLPELLLERNK